MNCLSIRGYRMISRYKGVAGLLLTTVLMLCVKATVSAGTGVYIGKEVSRDGSTIIAGSMEYEPGLTSYVQVVPRQNHDDGEALVLSNGFEYKLPGTTYKYQIVKGMDISESVSCSSVVTNEYGLAVSAGSVAKCNYDAISSDSYVDGGIAVEEIPEVLGATCDSADVAVRTLAQIVDEYGCTGGCEVMIADRQEAWYMEIYTGHQYAAVKMPKDRAAVIGDEYMIQGVEAWDDALYSEKLYIMAEENDFVMYDNDGNIMIAQSYGEESDDICELLYEPDEAESIENVFNIYRDEKHSVSNENVDNVHVIQIYDSVPAEMSDVLWLSYAKAEYSPFLPMSNIIDNVPAAYSMNVTKQGYNDDIAAFCYDRNVVLADRDEQLIGSGIRSYWEGMEALYIHEVSKYISGEWAEEYEESPESAAEIIESYCSAVMDDAFVKTNDMYEDVIWYMMNMSINDSDAEPIMFEIDIEEYANRMDWETTLEDNVFTAVRDNDVIKIIYDENGSKLIECQVSDLYDDEKPAEDERTVEGEKTIKDDSGEDVEALSITEGEVIDTIEALDDTAKKELSDLIGIDVNEAISNYNTDTDNLNANACVAEQVDEFCNTEEPEMPYTPDMPVTDVQAPDIQVTDVPVTDVQVIDIQMTDVPVADIPITDIQADITMDLTADFANPVEDVIQATEEIAMECVGVAVDYEIVPESEPAVIDEAMPECVAIVATNDSADGTSNLNENIAVDTESSVIVNATGDETENSNILEENVTDNSNNSSVSQGDDSVDDGGTIVNATIKDGKLYGSHNLMSLFI